MSGGEDGPLSPRRVEPLLHVATWRLVGGASTGSTNDDAKALARAGDPGDVAVVATEQTQGRGRFDRDWDSPRGGVYASVILRPDIAPDGVGAIALAAGLGIARGLDRMGMRTGGEIRLKWPNDLRVGGRKLCGVLTESAMAAGRVEWVVIGFGINVQRPVGRSAGSDGSAVYLTDLMDDAAGPDLAVVAAAALDGVAETLAVFDAEGFGSLQEAYTRRSDLVGEHVIVRDATGTVVAHGVVAGFDAVGHLVISGDEGPTVVAAGEVTLRD